MEAGFSFHVDVSSHCLALDNLPEYSDRFFGQEATLARIAEALGAAGVVTLTGPAGAGKTRTAAEVARGQREHFVLSGGAWFCELDGARTTGDLCRALASVLGVALTGREDPVSMIGAALGRRGKTLLVLDSLDLAVEPAREAIGKWIAAAPEARLLVTSWEALGLDPEVVVEVPPLDLPRPGDADLTAATAVQLFVDRARRVRPGYEPGEGGGFEVAEIVSRLQGLPLAIELAAARMDRATSSRLVSQLAREDDTLMSRVGRPHEDALQQAIEGSWSFLEPSEQAALVQCSVFKGGFATAAAIAVVDLTSLEAPPIPDVLHELQRKSLLRNVASEDAPGEVRHRLYRGVREYARDHRSKADGTAARERHAAFFLSLGRRLFDATGPERRQARTRLATERANLVAVFERARRGAIRDAKASAMRAALFLLPLATDRGPLDEYLEMLQEAMEPGAAAAGSPKDGLWSEMLIARGRVRRIRGDLVAARADLEEAATRARKVGGAAQEARALMNIGGMAVADGRLEEGERALQRAWMVFDKARDTEWQARSLVALGDILLRRGVPGKAGKCYEQAVLRARSANNAELTAHCLCMRANHLRMVGRFDEALPLLERALALQEEDPSPSREASVRLCMGGLGLDAGRVSEARADYERSRDLYARLGSHRWEGLAESYLGLTCHEAGDLSAASQHLRKGERLLRDSGDPRVQCVIQCCLGAVEASRGHIALARWSFRQAESHVASSPSRVLELVLQLGQGFLAAALARDAEAAGKKDDAAKLHEQARQRLERGLAAVRPRAADSPARGSDISDVVRTMVRTLQKTAAG